jgi:hypothetical protein
MKREIHAWNAGQRDENNPTKNLSIDPAGLYG